MLVPNNRRPRVTGEYGSSGTIYDLDVTGLDILFFDCSSNDLIIGGLAGGIHGQVLHLVKQCNSAHKITLLHGDGSATQKIYLHRGSDEELDTEYGGWTLVFLSGTGWVDTSHARHV